VGSRPAPEGATAAATTGTAEKRDRYFTIFEPTLPYILRLSFYTERYMLGDILEAKSVSV
jgi:hypothetical protein